MSDEQSIENSHFHPDRPGDSYVLGPILDHGLECSGILSIGLAPVGIGSYCLGFGLVFFQRMAFRGYRQRHTGAH